MFLEPLVSYHTSCGHSGLDTENVVNECRIHIYTCVVYKVEKAMAPHSSTLAWKIPWTAEPGGL